jgi:hypothetical protein
LAARFAQNWQVFAIQEIDFSVINTAFPVSSFFENWAHNHHRLFN